MYNLYIIGLDHFDSYVDVIVNVGCDTVSHLVRLNSINIRIKLIIRLYTCIMIFHSQMIIT